MLVWLSKSGTIFCNGCIRNIHLRILTIDLYPLLIASGYLDSEIDLYSVAF